MNVLDNDYKNVDLINLGFQGNGRGPYIIRQDGILPGSESVE